MEAARRHPGAAGGGLPPVWGGCPRLGAVGGPPLRRLGGAPAAVRNCAPGRWSAGGARRWRGCR
eukprot:7790762-Lingulodinium_polyedra.AAC.1